MATDSSPSLRLAPSGARTWKCSAGSRGSGSSSIQRSASRSRRSVSPPSSSSGPTSNDPATRRATSLRSVISSACARSSELRRSSSSSLRTVSSAAPNCLPRSPKALAMVTSRSEPEQEMRKVGTPSMGMEVTIAAGGAPRNASRALPKPAARTAGRSGISIPSVELRGIGNAESGIQSGQRCWICAMNGFPEPASTTRKQPGPSSHSVAERPSRSSPSRATRRMPAWVLSRWAATATSMNPRIRLALRARSPSCVITTRTVCSPAEGKGATWAREGIRSPFPPMPT